MIIRYLRYFQLNFVQSLRSFSSQPIALEALKKSPLHEWHLSHHANMVPFAGWYMPLKYSGMNDPSSSSSIIDTHLHTRRAASLFDVSHMLSTRIYGEDKFKFIEKLTTAEVMQLPSQLSKLTVFLNHQAGILDDCLLQKRQDYIWIISNAINADKIKNHLNSQLSCFTGNIKIDHPGDQCLLALQGPIAAKVLESSLSEAVDFKTWFYGTGRDVVINGQPAYATRTGYTGEDGFEISCTTRGNSHLLIADALSKHPDVKLAGLAVRDTLRLEASMNLYGHEMDESIDPIQAALKWTISKPALDSKRFIGADALLEKMQHGILHCKVGLLLPQEPGIPPARTHAIVLDELGKEKIGWVTSGGPSPCLQRNIALAYINSAYRKSSNTVQVMTRDRLYPAIITKLPFVPPNYYKMQQSSY